jgi:hypothetical protein
VKVRFAVSPVPVVKRLRLPWFIVVERPGRALSLGPMTIGTIFALMRP